VSKCLEWDPKKRITAKEALLHKWIVNGLPENIRQQHVEQIETFRIL
jgi:dual specificity tyrosine-phosphorylation-regulated kinase 2/3/4